MSSSYPTHAEANPLDQVNEMDEFLREATALAQRVNQRLREQGGSEQAGTASTSGRLRVSGAQR